MRSRIGRILAISTGVLVVIFLAAVILFQTYGPRQVLEVLKQRVETETNGRYTLAADSLDFDLWSLSVHLKDFRFQRDTAAKVYSGIPLFDKFNIHVEFQTLDVNYVRLFRFVFFNTIRVEELRLLNPSIEFRKNRNYDPEASEEVSLQKEQEMAADSLHLDTILADTSAFTELKESGSVFVPTLIVDDLLISNANFALYDGRKRDPIQEVRGFNIHLTEVHSEKDAPFSAEQLSLRVDHASTLLARNTAKLEVMGVNITADTFHIDSLHYGNIIDPYRVNRFKGFRAAWLDVQLQDLNLKGIHYERMIADSALIIDKVAVGNLWLRMFKDKAEPRINPAHKPLPPEQIRNIPLDLEIDTIEVVHADLHVEMQAAKAFAPGYVNLNDLYLLVTNLTNMEEPLQKNATMEVFAEGEINHAGAVEVDFQFNLLSPEDAYTVHASAGPMDATRINNFIGSQFFIEFKSGYVDEMVFEYDGNNKVNVGQMDLQYRDLKVQKLQHFEKFIEGHPHTGFFSGLGNMLIPNNRSKDQKKYKTAVVYYEKEYNRDVIHGLIQSMLSGVVSSVGLSGKDLDKKLKKADHLTREDIEKSAEKAERKAQKADRKKQKEAARARRKAEKAARKNKKEKN